ncbi:MAG: hypothetical protein ACRCYF_07790, partial [Shewanella sp.]
KEKPQAKRYILKLLTTQRLGLFLFIRNGDNFAQNIARFCSKSLLSKVFKSLQARPWLACKLALKKLGFPLKQNPQP